MGPLAHNGGYRRSAYSVERFETGQFSRSCENLDVIWWRPLSDCIRFPSAVFTRSRGYGRMKGSESTMSCLLDSAHRFYQVSSDGASPPKSAASAIDLSKGCLGFQPWNCQRCLQRQPVGLSSFPPFVAQRNAPTGWCLGGISVAAITWYGCFTRPFKKSSLMIPYHRKSGGIVRWWKYPCSKANHFCFSLPIQKFVLPLPCVTRVIKTTLTQVLFAEECIC